MKKTLSILIVLTILILTASSIPVFAQDAGTISVTSVSANPGETVSVIVRIDNNPGFCYLRLGYGYDTASMTLTGVDNGTVSTDNFGYSSLNLVWDAGVDSNADGTLCTLFFKISDDAAPGSYDIKIIFRECYNYGEEDVPFSVVDGTVTIEGVQQIVLGDVNEDGKVNARDITLLKKFIAGTASADQLNVANGDINGDGKHNARDITAMKRYIAVGHF